MAKRSAKPRDTNQRAAAVVAEATREDEDVFFFGPVPPYALSRADIEAIRRELPSPRTAEATLEARP